MSKSRNTTNIEQLRADIDLDIWAINKALETLKHASKKNTRAQEEEAHLEANLEHVRHLERGLDHCDSSEVNKRQAKLSKINNELAQFLSVANLKKQKKMEVDIHKARETQRPSSAGSIVEARQKHVPSRDFISPREAFVQQMKENFNRQQAFTRPSPKGKEETVINATEKNINAIKERMINHIVVQIEPALMSSKEDRVAYQALTDKIKADMKALQQQALSKEEWERQEHYQMTISLGLPKRKGNEKHSEYYKAIIAKWPSIKSKLENAEHELTEQMAKLTQQKETLEHENQAIFDKVSRLREQVASDRNKRHILDSHLEVLDELGKKILYIGVRVENLEKSKGVVDDIIPEMESYREKLKAIQQSVASHFPTLAVAHDRQRHDEIRNRADQKNNLKKEINNDIVKTEALLKKTSSRLFTSEKDAALKVNLQKLKTLLHEADEAPFKASAGVPSPEVQQRLASEKIQKLQKELNKIRSSTSLKDELKAEIKASIPMIEEALKQFKQKSSGTSKFSGKEKDSAYLESQLKALKTLKTNIEKTKPTDIPALEDLQRKLHSLNTQTSEVVRKVSPQLLQKNRNRPNS